MRGQQRLLIGLLTLAGLPAGCGSRSVGVGGDGAPPVGDARRDRSRADRPRFDQPPALPRQLAWAKAFQGGEVRALAVGADGSLFLAGQSQGELDLGGGPLSPGVFLTSFSPAGEHRWSHRFGEYGDEVSALALGGDGSLTLGGAVNGGVNFGGGQLWGGRRLFVAGFSAAGAYRWATCSGGEAAYGLGLALAAGPSNVYLAGQFDKSLDLGAGPMISAGHRDIFVASLSGSAGSVRWAKRFGAEQEDIVDGVTVDGAENVTVSGRFSLTVDFGGGPIAAAWHNKIFAASYTSAGAHRWSKCFSVLESVGSAQIAASQAGELGLAGYVAGSVNFGDVTLTTPGTEPRCFVARLGPAGEHRWSKLLEAAGQCLAQAVAVDGAGGLHLGGYFTDTVDLGGGPLKTRGQWDAFAADLTGAGAHRWSASLGGSGYDDVHALALGPDGALFLAGGFDGELAGAGVKLTGGQEALFVIKLTP